MKPPVHVAHCGECLFHMVGLGGFCWCENQRCRQYNERFSVAKTVPEVRPPEGKDAA